MKPPVSYEIMREMLSYNPATGEIKWLVNRGAYARIGCHAGGINKQGYVVFELFGKQYQAHRAAWLLQTGEWPERSIDHINRIRSDNRWANLRLATAAENIRNSGARKNNLLGIKGVRFHQKDKLFHARITHHGVRIHLGCFKTAREAEKAYTDAASKLHGQFFYR